MNQETVDRVRLRLDVSPASPSPWRFREDTYEVVDACGYLVIEATDPVGIVDDEDLEICIEWRDGRIIAAAPDMLAWIFSVLRDPQRFREDEMRAVAEISKKLTPECQ